MDSRLDFSIILVEKLHNIIIDNSTEYFEKNNSGSLSQLLFTIYGGTMQFLVMNYIDTFMKDNNFKVKLNLLDTFYATIKQMLEIREKERLEKVEH